MVSKFLGLGLIVLIGFLMIVLFSQPAWLKFIGMIVMIAPVFLAIVPDVQERGPNSDR